MHLKRLFDNAGLPTTKPRDSALQAVTKEVVGIQVDEVYKNNDPATVAAFYAEDAVLVTDTGLIYGREAIQKHFADLFKQVHFSDHVGKVDQYSPRIIGNQRWDTGERSATIEVQGQKGVQIELKGYFGCIDIREGNDWKIRMLTYNMTPPPAPPARAK